MTAIHGNEGYYQSVREELNYRLHDSKEAAHVCRVIAAVGTARRFQPHRTKAQWHHDAFLLCPKDEPRARDCLYPCKNSDSHIYT